ncbi:MAG TPA: sigma factor-like helix-turn-helix DNA-binding protein [Candidatus Paceibacterota bacterium]|nr:sigma factor-like helix-turn-helix DNA-binding protein [Candidatus Paceibacterota bacterium]
MPTKLSYKPTDVSKRLLGVLPDRSREVLVNRLGLTGDSGSQTLEAIGKKHGITRERVRQIENFALNSIRKSDRFQEEAPAFLELRDAMYAQGGVVEEENFLNALAKDAAQKNHIRLLLILGDDFQKLKEDRYFRHRWTMDPKISDEVHRSLAKLHGTLTPEHLISEDEIISMLLDHINSVPEEYKNPDTAKEWLVISKVIGRNPLNDWGLSLSPNVSVRGIRDYAFLVLRKNKKPMHFTEVAARITDEFNKKAHTATCHNELIKDPRFVLVGRGLYGLSEWGYSNGVVREVIRDLLRKNGPLDKESIVEQVLKERFVKENTVLVNLQNSRYFRKLSNGKFALNS